MFSMFRNRDAHASAEEVRSPAHEESDSAASQPTADLVPKAEGAPAEGHPPESLQREAAIDELPDGISSDFVARDPEFTPQDTGISSDETLPPDSDEALDAAAVSWNDVDEEVSPIQGLGDGGQLPAVKMAGRRRGSSRALKKAATPPRQPLSGQQRLLLLDTWNRSGLPAGDFAALIGLSKHTLYKWKKQFDEFGPAGLADQPRGTRRGSQLPELTRRTILMLKEAHPEWGCQRISDMLCRGPALPASASAVARVLHEAGYEAVDIPTKSHPDKVRRFERARPNQLWQTDLFTFVLKRQNRRVHMVAFQDDHSRFMLSFGLHATASTALVIEALEAAIASYGPAEEVLTDNGPQYVTWRGTSQFTRHLQKRGIQQIVARPRRPQTLGKIERFWGTLWREFLEAAVFVDLADARTRIGHFIDYYNFQRVHRGIDGLVPADRFFGAAQEVLKTLKHRVAANALELARHGQVRPPFYVTGQVDGESFSVHAEGARLILQKNSQPRQEITLAGSEQQPPASDRGPDLPSPVCPQAAPPSGPGEPADTPPPPPGSSAIDDLAGAPQADGPPGGAS